MEDAPYDFSFSGVKSAVLNHLNKCRMTGEPIVEADIAASFQQAVVDVLVDNAIRAAKDYHMDRLAIAGGVASNGALRAAMEAACEKRGHPLLPSVPDLLYRQCGHDRCGSLLRVPEGNPPRLGPECRTEPEAWRTIRKRNFRSRTEKRDLLRSFCICRKRRKR